MTLGSTVSTMQEMEKRLALAKEGKHLWTREPARRILAEVEESLAELDPGDVLVLDLKGVEVFDFSFANELFGKAMMRLPNEAAGRFLVVENVGSYARENLQQALEKLKLIMIERKGGKPDLLGRVGPADKQTLLAIWKKGEGATAPLLQKPLNVESLTAMNERLSKLVRLGLVRREAITSQAGREQYQYRVLS